MSARLPHTWERPEERLADRLVRYGQARKRSKDLAAWLLEREPDRAAKLDRCGELLHFRRRIDEGTNHLVGGKFCQQPLLCQLCAIRRAAKLCGTYAEKIETRLRERLQLRPLFVTLTVPDGPDLVERFGHVESSLRGWIGRARRKRNGGRNPTALDQVAGGVGAFEFKRGRGSGEWHPHYHGVWLVDGRLDWGAAQREWAKQTGTVGICHFQHLTSWQRLHAGEIAPSQYNAALGADLVEVFKYALKFGDLEYSDTYTAFRALSRRRLVHSFGSLWGVDVPEDLFDGPIDWDAVPFIDLLFRYVGGRYRLDAASSAGENLRAASQ